MSLNGLSLRDLEYLVAVAEHGHFGRAADACHVSQPSLSAGVRKIEDTLGFRVFERTSRKVLLTARGAPAVARAKAVIDAAERFLAAEPTAGDPLSGRFVLGAIATIGPYLFRHVLRPLHEAHPELDLIIEEGLTDNLIDRLRDGSLDAVILSPPVADDGLAVEPCYRERFHLAEAARTSLSSKPADLDELDMRDAVLLEDGHCLRDQTLSVCAATGIRPRQTAMSLETLKAMVASGSGFSLIPETAIGDTLGGLVRYRALSDPRIGRTVALAWRRSRTEDADIRALLGLLRRVPPPGALRIEGVDTDGL
ncbi:MAG: LysR substrate-binding domain-containing protein [Thalassobaculaceae bacterium]|nr:LysR substrate-binding domain-containing protein [Thalassobaculaceae bacterium]